MNKDIIAFFITETIDYAGAGSRNVLKYEAEPTVLGAMKYL